MEGFFNVRDQKYSLRVMWPVFISAKTPSSTRYLEIAFLHVDVLHVGFEFELRQVFGVFCDVIP